MKTLKVMMHTEDKRGKHSAQVEPFNGDRWLVHWTRETDSQFFSGERDFDSLLDAKAFAEARCNL